MIIASVVNGYVHIMTAFDDEGLNKKGFAFGRYVIDMQGYFFSDVVIEIVYGRNHRLDLLLYNRDLRRLVAVEIKYGRFEASHKGQLQLYLGWLDKYERRIGEESPIGIILCSESGREEVELLKLDRDGILVAEYWTALPPKAEFEQKIQDILTETRERLMQRNLLLPEKNDS
jgi:hypothetical protein